MTEKMNGRPARPLAQSDRRARSTTMPPELAQMVLEPALSDSGRNKTLAARHLATLLTEERSFPADMSERLCPKCVLYAREKNLIPLDDNASAEQQTVHAPTDLPEAMVAERSKRMSEHQAALTRQQQQQDERPARVRSESFETSGSLDGDAPPAHAPPAQTPRLELLLLARRRDSTVMSLLVHGSCDFSYTELYNSIWPGIADPTTREQFWTFQAAVSSDAASMASFERLLHHAHLPRKVFDQICKDLYRTFPNHNDRPLFVSSLYRGLVVHAALRPDIGYVQGMNALWGLIVLNVTKPQSQLVVAEHLVRQILPHYFTTDPCLGPYIDGAVLDYYFRRQRPADYDKYAERFAETDGDQDEGDTAKTMERFFMGFCDRNFTTLFAYALPQPFVLRLWDMIMLRGAATLFEFSIRVLHYYLKRGRLARCQTLIEAAQMVQTLFEARETLEEREQLYQRIACDSKLPLGHIVTEDLAIRRQVSARAVFQRVY